MLMFYGTLHYVIKKTEFLTENEEISLLTPPEQMEVASDLWVSVPSSVI